MHPEAYAFVAGAVKTLGPFQRVVEFGSFDINGTIRPLFGDIDYHGVDLVPGPAVDEVADCSTWRTADPADCVVCCEVFEHTPDWPLMLEAAFHALHPGGVVIVTAAGPGRGPHSAVDGNALRDGEHYENIDPDALFTVLAGLGFHDVTIEVAGFDVRAAATK